MEIVLLFILLFHLFASQDIITNDGAIYARKSFPIPTSDDFVAAYVCMEDWVAFVTSEFVVVACNFEMEQRLRSQLANEVANGNANVYNSASAPYYDFSIDMPWFTINDCNTLVYVCNETTTQYGSNNNNETFCTNGPDDIYLLCTSAILVGTNRNMSTWTWTMDALSSSIILYLGKASKGLSSDPQTQLFIIGATFVLCCLSFFMGVVTVSGIMILRKFRKSKDAQSKFVEMDVMPFTDASKKVDLMS
jgi:hypothetical protein